VTYQIQFTTAAARQVKKLPRPARDKVLAVIATLADDPRPHGSRKLTGEDDAWRVRVGDYRVIYDVADTLLEITVIRAAHRREAYDR